MENDKITPGIVIIAASPVALLAIVLVRWILS